MNAKVYKVVSFPFGGKTITINVYKGKTRGVNTYLFDLNDLKQLDFDNIDFDNTYYELSELRKLGNFEFAQWLTEYNGGREISFTLKAGKKLEDFNPAVTSLNEPRNNLGYVMQVLKNAIVKVFDEKNKASSSFIPKWKVSDIVLRGTKNGNFEIVQITKVDSNKNKYHFAQFNFDNSAGKLYEYDYEEEIDEFDELSKQITFQKGDVFSIDIGRGYEEVTVFTIDDFGNINLVSKNGEILTNEGEEGVKRFLLRSGARVYQSMQKTTQPKFKVGDYILYDIGGTRYLYKVTSINDTQKTYIISYKDPKKGIEEATSIDWSNLEGRSELLQLKDGDRFRVTSQKFAPLDIVIKKPISSNTINGFVITSAESGTAVTNVKSEQEIKDYLYDSLAAEIKNTSSAVSSNNEPHNTIFSKKTGNIYAIVVDKVQKNYVDLIYFDEGEQETSVNVPVETVAENYTPINVDKHKKFLIPAKGLPPIKVSYTTVSSKYGITHILLKDDGKEYARFASVYDMLNYLLLSEAKVVLDGVSQDDTTDPTATSVTNTSYDDQMEQLTKDIAQLMFFKSVLSPIDFEKKIEISQEISKKQEQLNRINFYLLEKRLQSENLFDELFEQSFTPIQNAYSGVYSNGADETDYFTPNGKKSKLSDSLNLMIRTPQFKSWFGDWELAYLYKDTDAVEIDCSKVLTDDFEPMLVWHGTGQEFSYFKFDTFPAAYFAVSKDYSQFFADLHGGDDGFVIPFFLNIRNPLDLTHFKTNDVSVKDFFDYIFLQTGMDMDDLEVNPIFMDGTLQPLQTWIFIRNNPNMLKKISALNIFDGIRFYETNPNVKDKSSPAYQTEAFITFNANQSKIADPERGTILLASMKSFILEKGGAI